MSGYQGHRSWNAWNVSLWIGNDEGLYRFALQCIEGHRSLDDAARQMMEGLEGTRTPDGAPYTLTSVRKALSGLS